MATPHRNPIGPENVQQPRSLLGLASLAYSRAVAESNRRPPKPLTDPASREIFTRASEQGLREHQTALDINADRRMRENRLDMQLYFDEIRAQHPDLDPHAAFRNNPNNFF